MAGQDDPEVAERVAYHNQIQAKLNAAGKSVRFWALRYTEHGPYAQAVPLFGLGMPRAGAMREVVSGVEVLRPSGVIQGLTGLTPQINGLVDIVELDARPASCPFLYVWDGRQYRFLGDVIAASPPGLYIAPGIYAECDADEYIRIPEGMAGDARTLHAVWRRD